MGGAVVSFADTTIAEQQRAVLGGKVMSWAQMLADTVQAAK